MEKRTFHIHVSGKVQGVGFRPFVYGLAREWNICGEVSNGPDGVRITFNATEQQALQFADAIEKRKPAISFIKQLELYPVAQQPFSDFRIILSQSEGDRQLILTPDLDVCDKCLAEMNDPRNRRYQYPFITCTHCGPRFSIINDLPYDREYTTMDPFEMCPACLKEYNDPLDRRFYSQTNSCAVCGIRLRLIGTNKKVNENIGKGIYANAPEALPFEQPHEYKVAEGLGANDQTLIALSAQLLTEGYIIAVKGIGGFLLLADATNADAVQRLRNRKARPKKPFALMYPDLSYAQQHVTITDQAASLLLSHTKPILLLPIREAAYKDLAIHQIAPDLNQLGLMLPYAPLLHLLLQSFNRPLIATSANPSHHPIIYDDRTHLNELSALADVILTHNRDIVISQDDSVLGLSSVYQQAVIFRRSRGFAPTLLLPSPKVEDVPIISSTDTDHLTHTSHFLKGKEHLIGTTPSTLLSMGALQKGTFTIYHQDNLYVSPYLGEIATYDHELHYKDCLEHMLSVLQASPSAILVDTHPAYFPSIYGKALAKEWHIPVYAIPHHRAHFAAILTEHHLWNQSAPILGIVWDGTGLGEDGHIWGSECFIYQSAIHHRASTLTHITHLAPFPNVSGDKMSRESRLSALAVAHSFPEAHSMLISKFNSTEWNYYRKLVSQEAAIPNHSMGRLFDAVSSLLGLVDVMDYEGEAAIRLEQIATTYAEEAQRFKDPPINDTFRAFPLLYTEELYPLFVPISPRPFEEKLPLLSISSLIKAIHEDIMKDTLPGLIAYRFHLSLVHAIFSLSEYLGITHIAFSGGVFQNRLLIDLLIHNCPKRTTLYFHELMSPNDENISVGQIGYFQHCSHLL